MIKGWHKIFFIQKNFSAVNKSNVVLVISIGVIGINFGCVINKDKLSNEECIWSSHWTIQFLFWSLFTEHNILFAFLWLREPKHLIIFLWKNI